MINHITIGINDLDKAIVFYDGIMGALQYERVLILENESIAYGKNEAVLWLEKPTNGKKASAGNGSHLCFNAPNKEAVIEFHTVGIKLGGVSEGKPAYQKQYGENYFSAYIKDPDGHKIEALFFDDTGK
jgi:catechol 2,3-dioxygenase-like lactoylglutathione lyase family enzyme